VRQQNLAVWGDRRVLREYGAGEGFLDAGERAAFEYVRERARGQPVLDLGVGGGRTVPLLVPLASRYVALDYTPAMVEVCRHRYPAIDVQLGDARDLTRFSDECFALVVFSFNGIDAVDHVGRACVLREIHRVLRPGGCFWFSTLNLEGSGPRMRPWIPEWPRLDGHPLRFAARLVRMPARMARRIRNYTRVRTQASQGEGWHTGPLSAHDYRLLMHFTSLTRELRELAEAGFTRPLVLDNAGRPLVAGDDLHAPFWFQILAFK
jgi:SAM-dependent methyltransferase